MRTTWLATWLLFPAIASPQTAPLGDIYQSGGAPQPVEQSFQKLYQIAAQITADPSSFYQKAQADQSNWPTVAQAQAQWDTAMAQAGNGLTQHQRNNIIPCVAHLNAAIDDMERGYLIHITQQSSPLAERTVTGLYGNGKLEFAKCLSTGTVANNGGTPGSAAGAPGTATNPLQGGVSTSSPSASDFSNQILDDAQTLLQNAGRISKAMTDAMDVTKHNDIGISVAVSGYFGAAAEMYGLVAQQYKLLATAGSSMAAAQLSPVLEIANEATAESGIVANQAEQTVPKLGSTGGATANPPMGTGTDPAAAFGANYQDGVVFKGTAGMPGQGDLPICGVLSCARLAELLKRNIPTLRTLSVGIGQDGLTAPQMAAALKKAGIDAEVGTGMTNMMNLVRAGSPVIAGIKTTGAADAPLHAVVIEGLETQGGVAGLNIYDPVGSYYWQPLKSFERYFNNQFVRAL